jgi:hypothetical protein
MSMHPMEAVTTHALAIAATTNKGGVELDLIAKLTAQRPRIGPVMLGKLIALDELCTTHTR